jgi:glycosyltransferase involved in cell wall biosynthesis
LKKTKVTYIISNIDKALAFEWIADHLPDDRIILSFILLNPGDSQLEDFLIQHGQNVSRIHYNGLRELLPVTYSIWKILRKSRPDIIHCHMFDATFIGLLAAKIAGVKRRIYTRHHSTFNWEYNKKGVLFDRIINILATEIVAISLNVQQVLIKKEKVPVSKIHLIRHGFDLEAFQNVNEERVAKLAQSYNPNGRWPVVGVIARFVEWKGVQYIIPAFQQLLKDYPNSLLILANASGPYQEEIKKLLMNLPAESYRTIGFESDLYSLYQLFTVYVHTPIDEHCEAFGQTYVEALAARIPSVFTLSGIAPEFIVHKKNALVVPFKDSRSIFQAITALLSDQSLHNSLIANGWFSIEQFYLNRLIKDLRDLYVE